MFQSVKIDTREYQFRYFFVLAADEPAFEYSIFTAYSPGKYKKEGFGTGVAI